MPTNSKHSSYCVFREGGIRPAQFPAVKELLNDTLIFTNYIQTGTVLTQMLILVRWPERWFSHAPGHNIIIIHKIGTKKASSYRFYVYMWRAIFVDPNITNMEFFIFYTRAHKEWTPAEEIKWTSNNSNSCQWTSNPFFIANSFRIFSSILISFCWLHAYITF